MLLMQDQELEGFMHIMKCATLFVMPKLLACCEYHVALTSLQTPQQGVLVERCWSEQLLAHSWGCIAEGIRRAFNALREEGVRNLTQYKTAPCTCACCVNRRNSYGSDKCHCSGPVRDTPPPAQTVLPGPKESLTMALAYKQS